ncbi:MAG: hypothetical protein WCS60_04420, partial [Hydrogenophaga sp.]
MDKRKAWIGVLVLVLGLLVGAYVSGAVLFWRLGLSLASLDLTSYARYWWAYRDHALHGSVIRSSGLLGFGLPLLLALGAAGPAWLQRKGKLYGDARFACLRDLRKRNMLKPDDT